LKADGKDSSVPQKTEYAILGTLSKLIEMLQLGKINIVLL